MSDIEDDFDDEFIDAEFIDEDFEEDDTKTKKKGEDEDDEDNDNDNDDIEEDLELMKKNFEIDIDDVGNDIVYIVPAEQRITSEKLSDYEIAEIINVRATNISKGGKIFTNIEGLYDPIEMAKKELLDRKCPLYIKRNIGFVDNILYIEKWSPNEMIYTI